MCKTILFIGGSPCSGKSTVAERISREFGAYYFKVDEILGELLDEAAAQGHSACALVRTLSPEENWMRAPFVQCREEFQIYQEIAPLVFHRIDQIQADLIITEGAAYTPQVMAARKERYITIVPSPDFQISHYRQREWVPFVLAECTDKEAAFRNWMQRDVLFAKQVQEDCRRSGVPCIVNGGDISEDEMFRQVTELLGLNTKEA